MCQDKYWAFERVLGHELAPVLYGKTLNFVQNRRDCEEYCLQEKAFICRSALYNDDTTECKLSQDDRRTQSANFYRNNNPKISYLENQCIRSHNTCPYVPTADAYPAYTDHVETTSTAVSNQDGCEKSCNDNRRFLCRSYAFYSSNGQCFLSGDDSASAGQAAITHRPGIIYYERKCPKTPGASTVGGFTTAVTPHSGPGTQPHLTSAAPPTAPSGHDGGHDTTSGHDGSSGSGGITPSIDPAHHTNFPGGTTLENLIQHTHPTGTSTPAANPTTPPPSHVTYSGGDTTSGHHQTPQPGGHHQTAQPGGHHNETTGSTHGGGHSGGSTGHTSSGGESHETPPSHHVTHPPPHHPSTGIDSGFDSDHPAPGSSHDGQKGQSDHGTDSIPRTPLLHHDNNGGGLPRPPPLPSAHLPPQDPAPDFDFNPQSRKHSTPPHCMHRTRASRDQS